MSGKRKLCWALALAALLLLSGCGRLVPEETQKPEMNVYSSFYPVYALTEMIAGGVPGVQTHCLVQPQDGCLRNYALSDWDAYLLGSAADLLVIGGRGLESFENQLYETGDERLAILTAFTDQVLVNESAGAGSEDSSHWDTANPHVYMSVARSGEVVGAIAEALALFDPENAALYAENLKEARAALDELLVKMRAVAANAAGQKAILLNEALVYTAEDLDIVVDGWFARESGQNLSEAEFERFLAAVEGCEARVVLIEKQAPASLVRRLEQAGYAVARLDILSEGRAERGADSYFQAQAANAEAVAAAFRK